MQVGPSGIWQVGGRLSYDTHLGCALSDLESSRALSFLLRRQAFSKTKRETQTMSQRRTRASLPSRLSEPIAGSAKKRHGYEVFARKSTLLSKGSPTETSKEAGTAAKAKVPERRLLFLQPSFRVVRRMVPGSISVSRRTWARTTTCDRDLHACPSQVARVQTRTPPKSP